MMRFPTVKKNIEIASTGAGPSLFSSSPVATEARPPDMATGEAHATVCRGVAWRSVVQNFRKYRMKIPILGEGGQDQ